MLGGTGFRRLTPLAIKVPRPYSSQKLNSLPQPQDSRNKKESRTLGAATCLAKSSLCSSQWNHSATVVGPWGAVSKYAARLALITLSYLVSDAASERLHGLWKHSLRFIYVDTAPPHD